MERLTPGIATSSRILCGAFIAACVVHAFDEQRWGWLVIVCLGISAVLLARALLSNGWLAFAVAAIFLLGVIRADVSYTHGVSQPPPTDPFAAARGSFRNHVEKEFVEPEASLVAGLLAGDISGLPKTTVRVFRDAGTAHVLAVSGYNVHLVIETAAVLCAVVGVRRRRAAFVLSVAVIAFALFTGAQSSVVRAAIMGGASILATCIGRKYDATNSLLLAAALMLLHDPAVIRHDIGFQLSFAAVLGLRHLSPFFERVFTFVPKRFGLRGALAQTAGATLATTPVSLLVFGTFAVASLPANLAIAPFVSLVTLLAAACMAISVFSHTLAIPLAATVTLLLRAMIASQGQIVALLPALRLTVFRELAALVATVLAVAIVIKRRPKAASSP